MEGVDTDMVISPRRMFTYNQGSVPARADMAIEPDTTSRRGTLDLNKR